MTAKEIMQALIDGKKVGPSPYWYYYLNMDGDLVASEDMYMHNEHIGLLFNLTFIRVQPEEGP